MKAGLATVAATSAFGSRALSAEIADIDYRKYKKQPGETKVVYLGGDQLHNPIGQRQTIRSIIDEAGWRFMSTTDARYVTPELISDADLLIITRWDGGIEGWSPDPIQEGAVSPDGYLSDELFAALQDNVKNRGMGFMALHCTVATSNRAFLDFMGINWMMHGPVQTVKIHNHNPNHPISKGIPDYLLPIDENFGVELIDKNAAPLYESTGMVDHRHDIAGWCVERGAGRIVGLAAGHTRTAWRHPEYRKLYWRGAHWALKRDIPPFG